MVFNHLLPGMSVSARRLVAGTHDVLGISSAVLGAVDTVTINAPVESDCKSRLPQFILQALLAFPAGFLHLPSAKCPLKEFHRRS